MTEASMMELLGVDMSTLKATAEKANTIEQDRYDTALFNEVNGASPELQSLTSSDENRPTFPDLMKDVWATFYKAAPELVDAERIDQAHRINRTFTERLLEDQATQETRIYTQLDELAAAVATIGAGQKLAKEIEERPELQNAFKMAAQIASAENRGRHEVAESMANGLDQELQGAARQVRRAIREAIQEGKEDAAETVAALAGWGMEPGDLKSLPIQERLELVKRLKDYNFKKMTDMVGRMRNLAKAKQKTKIKKQRDEIHGIQIGNDIPHILPAELATIRHPALRKDFLRRYAEGELLQYELQAKEKQGRGPLVALVDVSYSMKGERIDMASAIALALVDTASRQKRQAAVVFFDTEIKKTFEFKPGEKDLQKFIEIGTFDVGGGTDYEPALTEAQRMIGTTAYKSADIVMITDDECKVSEEFLAAFKTDKAARQYRAWVVTIGGSGQGQTKEWADRVWPAAYLTDEIAGELFEEI